jgi:hypothetical protein
MRKKVAKVMRGVRKNQKVWERKKGHGGLGALPNE